MMTPLHIAIIKKNIELAEKLIELGSDLEAVDVAQRKPVLFFLSNLLVILCS